VPTGDAVPEVIPLTLPDAVNRALRYNLGAIVADVATRRAAAARLSELSALLPNVTGRSAVSSQQVNLKAFGFGSFPGIPTIVGPFQVFDLRAALSQAVFDLRAINGLRASRETAFAADWSSRNARDLVTLAVVNLYLQTVTGAARVRSADAQIATAEAEYKQAQNLKAAGTVAGIDVLRAQVQLQAEQQRGIALRNDFEREKMNLARAIGLPLGQEFSLATEITDAPAPAITLQQALGESLQARADYRAALASERAAEFQRKSASSARLPAVYFNGDYGTIGPSLQDNHGTYTAALGVQVPIFEGGRIRAGIEDADALLQQRKAETADLRGRIDYEVRTSFLDLNAARDRVAVARSARELSNQQLTQARDRFAAGVANNLEVVQAQQAVAQAEENYIDALYAFNLAKASLGRATGRAERIVTDYLGVTKP
jgi:outer membrane protein TolC